MKPKTAPHKSSSGTKSKFKSNGVHHKNNGQHHETNDIHHKSNGINHRENGIHIPAEETVLTDAALLKILIKVKNGNFSVRFHDGQQGIK